MNEPKLPSPKLASEEHEDFVAKLKAVKDKKEFTHGKINMIAYPDVFSPVHSNDTEWFAGQLPQLCKDKNVLEIGSGTGAIALTIATEGAKSITVTDINPHAIENIKENQIRTGIQFPVYEGSLFEPLPADSKFDVIFWNHPFQSSDTEATNTIEASMVDFKYQFLRKYLKEGLNHLSPNGKLYLGTGNLFEFLHIIENLAEEEGVKLILVTKTKIQFFKGAETEMEIGIFEVQKIS